MGNLVNLDRLYVLRAQYYLRNLAAVCLLPHCILNRHLSSDKRLKAVCSDGDDFVHSLQGQRFDLIFADTWSGKYQMLDEVLTMLKPAGLYIIDDMLPQPNWPDVMR